MLQIANIKINADWRIMGETKVDGEYAVEENNGAFSAVAYDENAQRIGTYFKWSRFYRWAHVQAKPQPVMNRRGFMVRNVTNLNPYKGCKFYIALLYKGNDIKLDPKKVEEALDTFDTNCFAINGEGMEPEKIRILRLLGLDPSQQIPSPRPEDNGAMVPLHYTFMINYVIK